jgi:uncharacterized protein YjbJ (UPF0337 family)
VFINLMVQPCGRLAELELVVMSSLATPLVALQAPMPTMAITTEYTSLPILITAMSKRSDAAAKDAEGKLESAYGEMSGDIGHQIKGKSKQIQASAMNAEENVREGIRSVAKNVSKAAKDIADDID